MSSTTSKVGPHDAPITHVRRQLAAEIPPHEVDVKATVTKVASIRELEDAIEDGAAHIVLTEHLDFTTSKNQDILDVLTHTHSIRGNCESEPPSRTNLGPNSIPMLSLRAQQCVMFVTTDLFDMFGQNMWLDNLYLRLHWREAADSAFNRFVRADGGKIWMTNVTFQGELNLQPACQECGIGIWNSQVYAEDCTFDRLLGTNIVAAKSGGTVNLVGCTFSNNIITATPGSSVERSSQYDIMTPSQDCGALLSASREAHWTEHHTAIRIESCRFENNQVDRALCANSPDTDDSHEVEAGGFHPFFSDAKLAVWNVEGTRSYEDDSNSLIDIPEDAGFLKPHDPQILAIKQVLGIDVGPPKKTPDGLDSPGRALPAVSIATFAIVAVCALVLVLSAATIAVRMTRRRSGNDKQEAMLIEVNGGLTDGVFSHHGRMSSVAANPLQDVDHDTFATLSLSTDPGPLAATASVDQKLEYINYQLDSLEGRDILRGLELQQGGSSRIQGGQGVIQFAVDKLNRLDYAIKFFCSPKNFYDEFAQYTDTSSHLQQFLPRVRSDGIVSNADGAFVDGHGRPMPPCIVMERGESLNMWVQRNKREMDTFTCMQIIKHIGDCLIDLHTAGYVHRDLKPGNIMWLPSQNRWTLIDFGCVAKIGDEAPMGFSLTYAAPEVLQAHFREHAKSVCATTALDAWSLGVLAVELFTGRPAIRNFEGQNKMVAQIVGEEALPWEPEDKGKELLQRAGLFKGMVLDLLARDPQHRLSIQSFQDRCSNLLERTYHND